MLGVNALTGKPLSGIEHLKQSIADILTTPIGSRVMRREYGSKNFQLVDRPLDNNLKIEIISASAEALDRWEPRFKLTKIVVYGAGSDGNILLDIEGKRLLDGKVIKLEGVKVA